MILIFCLSNLSIPAILMIVFSKMDKEIYIVTDQESIIIFFLKFLPSDHLILINSLKNSKTNIPYKRLCNLIKHKKELHARFKDVSNAELYFFYNAFGLNISWLLKRLSKRNKVYYCPDIDISNWSPINNIYGIIKKLKIYVLYGVWTQPTWTGDKVIFAVSPKFIRKITANTIKIDICPQKLGVIVKKSFSLEQIKILYLTGGLIESKIIEQEEFTYKTDQLVKILVNYKTQLKIHPRFNLLYSKENLLQFLPKYIPANLLIYLTDFVIGYSSATLFEAANNNIISISLLDFYHPISIERKESYKSYLLNNLKNGKRIFFPKNVCEIENILLK